MKIQHVINPARLFQQHSALALAAAVALGTALLAPSAQAAISVGASGSGILTFDSLPSNTEWSTLASWTGAPGSITNVATMDSAVAALTASGINTNLLTTTSLVGNARALYNSTQKLLQMRPTGTTTKGVVLLATLQNTSGSGITNLTISCTLGTPATGYTEQVTGLRGYYSLTGAASSWTVIPALCTDTAGALTTNVTLSSTWANGTMMYVLWVQDNNDATFDNAYTIDNVSFAPYPTLQVTVAYNGNGSTGGSVPTDSSSPYTPGATVTVLGNTGTLVRTDNTFVSWNTANDGSGTNYTAGQTFSIVANTTLYAHWITNTPPQPEFASGGFTMTAGTANFTFGTTYGYQYQIVYKNNLMDANWTALGSGWQTGDGTPITIHDPDAASYPQRFYRIEVRAPQP